MKQLTLIALALCACGHTPQASVFEVGDLDAADQEDTTTNVVLDYDGPVPDAFPFDPPVPPTFPCLDAGPDASTCPLPRSVCQGNWLEYFDDGKCVDEKCQFTVSARHCDWVCRDGGCLIEHLTAPTPQ